MYIWVAIDVDEQVKELRERAESYNREHSLVSSTFTLPFHISLKISFQVPDEKYEEAVRDIREFYRTLKPFQIKVRGIEQSGSIVWITMQESVELTEIHKKLDEMLYEKYAVIQHEFDKKFTFHTSVFMIDNQEQLAQAFGEIKATPIPEILRAEKYIIGSSAEGVPGTYCVVEEIQINV